MNKIQPRKLKGFQDFLPETETFRIDIIDHIKKIASDHCFQTINTPAMEYSEVLLGEGGETDKQVYLFEDNGGRQVGLRYDLTVPFARFVAEHQSKLVFPFKRLQWGPVWRAEKPQKGRYREFYQCDWDIIGVDSIGADCEIILAFVKILSAMPCGPFTVRVGSRPVLTEIIKKTLPDLPNDLFDQVLIALDKLDKIGKDGVIPLLAKLPGCDEAAGSHLLEVLTSNLWSDESSLTNFKELVLDKLDLGDSKDLLEAADRFVSTILLLKKQGQNTWPNAAIKPDLSLARGLAYYTGVVFETTIDQLPKFGSVCSGGRYNNLTERFGRSDLSGVGGSLGLDRFIAALNELGCESITKNKTQLFIALAGEQTRSYAMSVAEGLRTGGVSVDLAVKTNKLQAQMKYADRKKYQAVIILGEDEEKSKKFKLKWMETGAEVQNLSLEELQIALQPQ